MGKKWKVTEEEGALNWDSGGYERYNAVQYVYDTRILAKPTGAAKYSKVMQLFREGVKRNAKLAAQNNVYGFSGKNGDQLESAEKIIENDTNITDVDNCESYANTKKKQKKKKKCIDQDMDESSNEHTAIGNGEYVVKEEESQSVPKKKKKKSKRETSPVALEESIDLNSMSSKKSKKNTVEESPEIPADAIADSSELTKKQKKKKKNKDKESSALNDPVEETVQTDNLENAELTKKKKKKKKNRDKENSSYHQVNENIGNVGGSEHLENVQSESESISKKAQKKKKREQENEKNEGSMDNTLNDSVVSGSFDDSDSLNKKKKKKKKKAIEHENPELCTREHTSVPEEISPKKKKKKNRKRELVDEENAESDVPPKKKKANKSESFNENVANESVIQRQEKVNAGQWGAVTMGDDTRTHKFLRLMGGEKAKNPPSTNTQPVKKFNKALDNEQAAKLDADLENQFVKAKQAILTKGRGVGLGFEKAPGEGKKFYIDTNNSKSVKFDD